MSGPQVSRNGVTPGVPTSVTLTAQHVIPSATPNTVDEVFQKVVFFRLLASGGYQAIVEATLAGQQVNLNDKTFTYTFAWDPDSDLLLGVNDAGATR